MKGGTTTRALKFAIPALVLALAAMGCILVSGQFPIDFELDDFSAVSSSTVTQQDVDLNTEFDAPWKARRGGRRV